MKKLIYTSDLITLPEVKKALDEFIIWPVIKEKPKLLIDKNAEYDKTLLGNAVEILFELLIDNSWNSFIHPLKSYELCLLNILAECKKVGYRNLNEYYVLPFTGIYRKYGVVTERLLHVKKKEAVKVKQLIDDFYKAVKVLSDIKCFEKNIDDSMLSILIISNIMPLCKRFMMFYSKYANINENTISYLKKIYEHFPFEIIDLKKRVISEPPLYIGGTCGRPDFIVGDTLFEIKTTQRYLGKDHIRQIALYYLGLTECKYNRIDIKEIAVYYSLYGKLAKFKKSEIFNLNKAESTFKIIENLNTKAATS